MQKAQLTCVAARKRCTLVDIHAGSPRACVARVASAGETHTSRRVGARCVGVAVVSSDRALVDRTACE